jgi:hypothetical protein
MTLDGLESRQRRLQATEPLTQEQAAQLAQDKAVVEFWLDTAYKNVLDCVGRIENGWLLPSAGEARALLSDAQRRIAEIDRELMRR